MTWQDLIRWVKSREFIKGDFIFPVYIYDYPDFIKVGSCFCFRDGDVIENGKIILTNQTPDDIQKLLTKNFEE